MILELLIVKKQLFAGREDEVSAAINTLQNLVLEFHGELPPSAPDSQAHGMGNHLQLTTGPD
jgi:hypothetical protein